MQELDLYLWRVTDRVSGRRYITRHPMSEVSAKDLDPAAERIDSSHQRMAVARFVAPPSARRQLVAWQGAQGLATTRSAPL